MELCYRGQAHTLRIDWKGITTSRQAFEDLHQQRYGHRLQGPVELVNVRVGVTIAERVSLPVQRWESLPAKPIAADFINRQAMTEGKPLQGPLSICDAGSTIWVAPGWLAECDQAGHLLLNNCN